MGQGVAIRALQAIKTGLVFLAVLLLFPGFSRAADIVDMVGRTVRIPDKPTKIFCASPPALYLLYAVDASLAAGLNFPFTEQEKIHLRSDFTNLPVLGGWFGQGRTPNLESVLAAKPDFILAWYWHQSAANDVVEETAKTLGLPLVYVRLDTLDHYIEAFQFLGRILDQEKRGNTLATAAWRILADVAPVVESIPDDEKVWVYYAQGPDGLKTECDTSVHAELINFAGGRNIRSCPAKNSFGMESVSIEDVILGAPEVILAKERIFYDTVARSPAWSHVRAVCEQKVILIPDMPFNWFDRPPSFMRILGLCWLTNTLYPDRFPRDMIKEVREFYHLFLEVDLDKDQARQILEQ